MFRIVFQSYQITEITGIKDGGIHREQTGNVRLSLAAGVGFNVFRNGAEGRTREEYRGGSFSGAAGCCNQGFDEWTGASYRLGRRYPHGSWPRRVDWSRITPRLWIFCKAISVYASKVPLTRTPVDPRCSRTGYQGVRPSLRAAMAALGELHARRSDVYTSPNPRYNITIRIMCYHYQCTFV